MAPPPQDVTDSLRYAYHVMGDVRGQRILDYGCGSGENSAVLHALGAQVIGIDLSPELIEVARKRMEVNEMNWEVCLCTAYAIPEENCSYDIIFGAAILHHLDIEAASQEVFRLLKPGGRAIFIEPIRDLALLRWLRKIVPVSIKNASPGEYPLRSMQIEDFCKPFTRGRSKRFSSPWGRMLDRLGYELRWISKFDVWFAAHVTGRLAAVEVFEIVKPGE